jgi:hypothetical protein
MGSDSGKRTFLQRLGFGGGSDGGAGSSGRADSSGGAGSGGDGLPALDLEVQPSVASLPTGAPSELVLRARIVNTGTERAILYTAVARPDTSAGWTGPTWGLEVDAVAGGPDLVRRLELRTWYGPPGQPPGASWFETGRAALLPRKSSAHELPLCFLPREVLKDAQLAAATLDPEGFDGIASFPALAASAVLIWGARPSEVAPHLAEDELLRGHHVIFVPARGVLRMRLVYRQAAATGFSPEQALSIASAPFEVRVG